MASSSSTPTLSSSASVVAAQRGSARFLRALSEYGVILCTEHCCCYTPQNLQEHLKRKHGLKGQFLRYILGWVATQNVATTVTKPADYSLLISGLRHESGFVCNFINCAYRIVSEQNIQRHCSKEHGIDSRRKQREEKSYSKVVLQFFFAKEPEYFIVIPDNTTGTQSTFPPPSTPSTPGPLSSQLSQISDAQHISSALSIRLRTAVEEHKARYRQIGEPNHVSEITPWLRKSRFHIHLTEIDGALIETSSTVPRQIHEDARLYLIILSVDRVLRKAHNLVENLHHVDAKILNTFQVGTMTQDPFQQLQNKHSLDSYIHLFQSLVCYFIRVDEGHFDREMFVVTGEQRKSLDSAFAVMENMVSKQERLQSRHRRRQQRREVIFRQKNSDDNYRPSSDSESDNGTMTQELETELDQHILKFCVALVQQRAKRVYDSGVASFCAVASSIVNREDKSVTWTSENQIGGILSKLVYDCQLLILQKAHTLVDEGVFEEMGDALRQLCGMWILSDSRGPVGTLNDWRLYAMKVGASTVPPAIIVWDEDGQTLNYGQVRYGFQDLSDEMTFCLREAQDTFQNELCLGFSDIPTYPLHELQDNWSAWRAGFSFLDDTRNAGYWEGHDEWLIHHISQSVDHVETIFHTEQREHRESASWPFRSEFAKQYQVSVEKFLECMLVLIHKGSGQPARRVEFLGMRWRNVGMAIRNILLHSGYLLFILSYHKSQTRTHASRYPVRVLFPAVAQLLVQFFKLIQPFRMLMSRDVNIPALVGDYLWSDGEQPWPDDRMTRILRKMSLRSIGTEVSVAAWRQIAVGFAVKKFSGMGYEADVDLPGNADDDKGGEAIVADGVTLPAAFHAQAAHGPRTGNRAYGTTVNFSSGLTDAGLQAYLHTSKLWWTLFESHVHGAISGKRPRPPSMANETPSLLKRVAHRVRAPRHLRRWGGETVSTALRRLYGDPQARFRSDIQRHMVETVAGRHAEVVVILATGGGKSLAFMVPVFLPQAGTTVVVVPLVALKQDLVRRCWDAGVEYSVWDAHGNSERYTGAPLLFVSAEQAVKEPFRRFVHLLDANRQLDRVVLDECHLILTASEYRPKMALLRYIRELRCQVVFLSATLPPILMAQFQRRMLLDQPMIVRDITFRSDLFYDFHRQSKAGKFEDYAVEGVTRQIQGLAQDDQARIIVYVNTKGEARDMAARLKCEYYYSNSGKVDEKEQVMARWRDGIHRVIVATSAFGTGVDYAHVRVVIHLGLPTDAINFAQEVGRLGRDGQGGTSFIILPHTSMPIEDNTWAKEQYVTPLSERVMQRYVSQSRCLWATLSRYVDGVEKMQYCGRLGLECGVCRVRGVFQMEEEVDTTLYWDGIRSQGIAEAETSADEEEDDDEDGEMNEMALALQAGSQRLRLSERVAADQRARYLERCQRWKETCLICQLLRGGQGLDHDLDTCRGQDRVRFFEAKKATLRRRQQGWMKDHVACWRCGQLPTMCDGLQGVKGCELRDMVLPGGWAMFHVQNLWGQSLAEVSGQQGGFDQEERWMTWLGQECEVFGERGTHAVRMLAWLLEQMERGELAE